MLGNNNNALAGRAIGIGGNNSDLHQATIARNALQDTTSYAVNNSNSYGGGDGNNRIEQLKEEYEVLII